MMLKGLLARWYQHRVRQLGDESDRFWTAAITADDYGDPVLCGHYTKEAQNRENRRDRILMKLGKLKSGATIGVPAH